MVNPWKLKRVNQCDKCPWRVDVDPNDIPNYDVEQHRRLDKTIAREGELRFGGHAMSCHEHASDEGIYCVGWLMHQLGPGNNIGLRLQMIGCENAGAIRLHGEQHRCFEDTLP